MMNTQQLHTILSIAQIDDYTWRALLPECTVMWAHGYSELEAIEAWARQYDQPMFSLILAAILSDRAEHPRTQNVSKNIERPLTVDFPYRGKLYRIATNAGLPKRHIILPDGTVLVVCQWAGRIPSALADIRRNPEPMPLADIVRHLDRVLAEEILLLPGQTAKAMAILDFEGQRYAVDRDSHALIKFPDGTVYCTGTFYAQEPERIATISPFNPNDSHMSHMLNTFGKTSALPVAADYPGMPHEPRNLRIRFRLRGEQYILSHEAYEQHKWIVYVPDRGYYGIGLYLESSPVQLDGLSPLPDDQLDPKAVAVALRLADAVDTAYQGEL